MGPLCELHCALAVKQTLSPEVPPSHKPRRDARLRGMEWNGRKLLENARKNDKRQAGWWKCFQCLADSLALFRIGSDCLVQGGLAAGSWRSRLSRGFVVCSVNRFI